MANDAFAEARRPGISSVFEDDWERDHRPTPDASAANEQRLNCAGRCDLAHSDYCSGNPRGLYSFTPRHLGSRS
jgi:hypothetical protein